MLCEQRQQQAELLSNVRSLQSELTLLRHQNSGPAVVADNGADVPNLQLQMLQIMQDLSREVQSLKQDRQSDLLRTQLQFHVIPPNPIAASPVWSASACAGFPTPVNVATPVQQKHEQPSKQGSQGSASICVAKPPSSPGSSASSTTTIGGGGGNGGSPDRFGGSPGGSEGPVNGGFTPVNRSIGVGSGFHVLCEKEIYRSKNLSLVKIEQLPALASAFRSWRNSFITKTCSIDATGENLILSWLSEAFNSESGDSTSFWNFATT